jgi:hypothetical protein
MPVGVRVAKTSGAQEEEVVPADVAVLAMVGRSHPPVTQSGRPCWMEVVATFSSSAPCAASFAVVRLLA